MKNRMCCGLVAQCSHALFGQARDQPLIERRNQFLPSYGSGRIKCLLLFTGKALRLMQMNSCFRMKQILGKFYVDELTQIPYRPLRSSQKIFVTKQLVVRELPKSPADLRSPPVLNYNKE